MKDMYIYTVGIFLIPLIGMCLLFANLGRTSPFPVSLDFPNVPQINAQSMAMMTATPSAPPALKVVA